MRNSKVKAKLRRGEPVLLTTLHLTDPSLFELVGLMGFDGIWMDLEHHGYSVETASAMMRAARVGHVDIMARPAKGEFMRMGRLLEAGAQGIMYPRCDSADGLIKGLLGALDTLVIGDPADPATDVGPVIDEEARGVLDAHVERLKKDAKVLKQLDVSHLRDKGFYFGPTVAEVPTPDFLEREVFGPVLHIYRYDPADLPAVARKLAARGYGLTLGVHSRIEAFAEEVKRLVPAGNVYVNRSIIGAVVGVQPFGGEGLSGTGPKAGGPHALIRYAAERAVSVNIAAQGGDPALLNL